MTELATREANRLAELEAIVDRGMQTFAKVGQALTAIRDERLYRSTHSTFESYLDERWDMARSTANGYIAAAVVAGNVSRASQLPSMDHARILAPLTANEQRALARVISPLPRDQAREVVRRYRENGTALRDVQRLADQVVTADAYRQFLGVMRDVLGLSTLTTDEIFAGIPKRDIETSISSVANAAKFLRDCERVMRKKAG